MPVLITGGTGHIGTYVMNHLVAQGEACIAYDLAPNRAILEAVLGPDAAKVALVQGDILDLPLMARTARQHKVDKVVHLAYALGRATEMNPALGSRVNIEGTNNVFEVAGLVGAARVVWASSIAVFGPKSRGLDGVVGADAPYDPQTIYGGCKITNELSARRYSYIYGLEPIGLRFPVVYGPEIQRGWGGFLCDLASRLVRGEPAQAPRNDHEVSWGWVEDIADAVVTALEAPRPPRRVYTLQGFPATVRQVVDAVLELFPGAEAAPLEGYPMVWLETRFDLAPTKADLGWQPRVTIQEGMRRLVEHYRRRYG